MNKDEPIQEATDPPKEPRAWLVAEAALMAYRNFSFVAPSTLIELQELEDDDWLMIVDDRDAIIKIARAYRIRETLETLEVYFDKTAPVDAAALADTSLAPGSASGVTRIPFGDFCSALPKCGVATIDDVRLIQDEAYLRELLQLATVDDILGPAMGPRELIKDMGVCERYLVGKLAPQDSEGGTEGLSGATVPEMDEAEEPELETHTGRHDTGAEFESTSGRSDPEADAADEIDTTNNQSLVPSSFGLTFCVAGEVDRIEVEARWGRYERVQEHEFTKKRKNKKTDEEAAYSVRGKVHSGS